MKEGMENSIAVSVIIPVHNAGRYLEECLDSVVGQTLEPIEILCVNDGSTDNSGELLSQYSKKYTNIVVIEQENRGAGAARNRALRSARGQYAAFMDADDYYSNKDVLKEMYTAAQDNQVDICGGNMVCLYEGRQREVRWAISDENRKIKYTDYQGYMGFTCYIYRTDFLRRNDIWFPEQNVFEDPPFFVEALISAEEFYKIGKTTYVYRKDGKAWRRPDVQSLNHIIDAAGSMMAMAGKNKLGKLEEELLNEFYGDYLSVIWAEIYAGESELEGRLKWLKQRMDASLLSSQRGRTQFDRMSDRRYWHSWVEAVHEKEERLCQQLDRYAEVIIYGAGRMGRCFYEYLSRKGYRGKVYFAVSAENPRGSAYGIPVRCIAELEAGREIPVIVAVKGEIGSEMAEYARELGFINIEVWEDGEIKMLAPRDH